MQSALKRIRQAAVKDKQVKFTSLMHHIYNLSMLREAYYGLKRDAAPGVDGETWQLYGEELERNGFIYSVVGKGSFVSEQNNEMIKERKMKVIEEQLLSAVQNSKEIGVSLTELLDLLSMLYREEV